MKSYNRLLAYTVIFICISAHLSAQENEFVDSTEKVNGFVHGLIVKTDLLEIMNTLIPGSSKGAVVSAEYYLTSISSLQWTTKLEFEKEETYKQSVSRFSLEYRKYFLDCDPCKFYVAPMAAYELTSTSHRDKPDHSFINQKKMKYETGFSCGIQSNLTDHWFINPSVSAGVSFPESLTDFTISNTINLFFGYKL
jgi:hypothetical protein